MIRPWPRSLAGQLALLVGLALFVAQAINFALLLRERHQVALEQVAGPAATRFVDAADRAAQGRSLRGDRGRVRIMAASPVRQHRRDEAEIAANLRAALAEAGLRVGRIDVGTGAFSANEPFLRAIPPRRLRRFQENADILVIAVQRPSGEWLVQRAPWIRRDPGLVWRLAGQTAVLFVVMLVPVLWIARRLSRPLRALTAAAQGFGGGDALVPVPEAGPDDVSRLIAAFNGLRLRVTAMLDEKDRMLGAIGHDLRTPLAALRVRIESVEDEADRARMAAIVDEMNRTLDDILSLARLGRPSEAAVEVDLAALVDAVVEDFRDLGADVTFVEAPRLPMRLRPSLIRRAVRNLVENAVKYAGRATVAIEAGSDRVLVTVADEGPGIPEARLTDVFDAFTRLETSRNRDTGGIGLGLALARAIAEEAGGSVTLANRPSGGLLATIVLPRR